MKRLFLITFLLAVCWEAPAQVFRIPEVVVSALPTASAVTRAMFVVSDGASDADCTTGGGSSRVLCYSNGTSWEALGDGGTTSAPGSDTELIRNSAGAFAATTGLTFAPGQLSLSSVASNYAPINNTMFWRVVTPEGNNPDYGFGFSEVANPEVGSFNNSIFSWGYNPQGELVADSARWSWTIEGHWHPEGQTPLMELYESIAAGPVGSRFNSAAVDKVTGRKIYQYIAGDVINFYDGLGAINGAVLGGFQGSNFSVTGNLSINTGTLASVLSLGNAGAAITTDNAPGVLQTGLDGDIINARSSSAWYTQIGVAPDNVLRLSSRPSGTPPLIVASGDTNLGMGIIAAGTGSVFTMPSFSMGPGGSYRSADLSAIMDLASTTRGFLPPRMTTTERDAIATPATGLSIYNTTTNTNNTFNGTAWVEASGADNMGNQVATTDLDMSGFNVNDVIKVGNTVYANFAATGADQTSQISTFLTDWTGYDIVFPAGNYKVFTEFTVPANTRIRGVSGTAFVADATDTNNILIKLQAGARLENLKIDCTAHGVAGGTDDGCIQILAAGDSAAVLNSQIIDAHNHGIYSRDANHVRIENNFISTGISSGTGSHAAIFLARDNNYATIRGNKISTDEDCIKVHGKNAGGGTASRNVAVENNVCDYTGKTITGSTLAVELLGGTNLGLGAHGSHVTGNHIIPPAAGNIKHISIDGSLGVLVANNTSEAGACFPALECAGCQNTTFINNTIKGCTGEGFSASSGGNQTPQNVLVTGNWFGTIAADECVHITRGIGITIEKNVFKDCGAPTIWIQGGVPPSGTQAGIQNITIRDNNYLTDVVAGFFIDIQEMKSDSAWVLVENNIVGPDTTSTSSRAGTVVKRVAQLTGVRHVTFKGNVWDAMTSSGAPGGGTAAQVQFESGNVSDVRIEGDHFLNKPGAPAIQDLNTSGVANRFIGVRRTNMGAGDTYTAQDIIVNDPDVVGTTIRMHGSGSFTTGNLVQRAASGAFTDAGVLASNVVSIAGTNAWQNAQTSDETGCTLTDGATVTWNLTNCQIATITLGGNRTIDATTFPAGFGTFVLQIKQDATGSRVPTFTAGEFKWPGDVVPTFSTAPDAVDYISCVRVTSAILDCTSSLGFSRP